MVGERVGWAHDVLCVIADLAAVHLVEYWGMAGYVAPLFLLDPPLNVVVSEGSEILYAKVVAI